MEPIKKPAPPLQLFVLSAVGLDVYEGNQMEKKQGSFELNKPSLMSFSEDGSVVFISSEDEKKVGTFDTATGKAIATWPVEQPIAKAYVSPLGSFVLTWHFPPRSKPGEPEPSAESMENLVVWNAKTGQVVWRQKVKNAPESHMWPSVQWSSDERYAVRMATNTVFVLDGTKVGGKEIYSMHVKNLAQLSLVCGVGKGPDGNPIKQYRIATFVPEKNNTMANVTIWQIMDKSKDPAEGLVREAGKTFGRGQQVDFLWNNSAIALIIKAFSAVDKTGGSYYGTYDCFYIRVDGSVDMNLRPKREGTIHDIQWDVYGRRFVMVYGAQPAAATMYNLKGNAIAEFGSGSRNFASFSPSGHLLTLAGFGSLKGAIEVWDQKSIKKVAVAESFAASTFLWSPDSRFFVTATLSDRMKVDNVCRVFAYDGTLVKEINKGSPLLLRSVAWRPSPRGTYESLPPSPRCFENAAKVEAQMAAAPVRQKYVPPGMRNNPGASSSATAMLHGLRGNSSTDVVGRVQSSQPAVSPSQPAAPKRVYLVGEAPDEDEFPKPGKTPEKADPDKKIKKLKKKLRQVEALKAKDEATLTPDQKNRLKTEAALIKQIAELEKK